MNNLTEIYHYLENCTDEINRVDAFDRLLSELNTPTRTHRLIGRVEDLALATEER